jgi:cytidyltransferase-like protein
MYKLVAIAGTFDRLHKGHEYFITSAFDFGEKVLIGLTSGSFVKSKISNNKFPISNKIIISNFQTRKKELEKFLKDQELSDRSIITTIDDVYGPAVGNKEIEALVVTEETKEGGDRINKKRKELGLPELKLIITPFVLAEDQEKIASTRIRVGEIDRKGLLYERRLRKYNFGIPEELRQELKKSQGKLIKGNPNNIKSIGSEIYSKLNELNTLFIITVGDEVTMLINSLDIKPKLSIFDFRVNRIEKYRSIFELGFKDKELNIRKVVNPPGCITNELVGLVKESIEEIVAGKEKTIVIKIEGEDDLAAVPAILLAPLGSVVLYGQPGEGVVIVEVTEEKKKKLISLLVVSG